MSVLTACSPKPEPDPALPPSKQPPARPSPPVGQLFLTHAAATTFAASPLFEDFFPHHNHDGDLPPLSETPFAHERSVPASRLPAR